MGTWQQEPPSADPEERPRTGSRAERRGLRDHWGRRGGERGTEESGEEMMAFFPAAKTLQTQRPRSSMSHKQNEPKAILGQEATATGASPLQSLMRAAGPRRAGPAHGPAAPGRGAMPARQRVSHRPRPSKAIHQLRVRRHGDPIAQTAAVPSGKGSSSLSCLRRPPSKEPRTRSLGATRRG